MLEVKEELSDCLVLIDVPPHGLNCNLEETNRGVDCKETDMMEIKEELPDCLVSISWNDVASVEDDKDPSFRQLINQTSTGTMNSSLREKDDPDTCDKCGSLLSVFVNEQAKFNEKVCINCLHVKLSFTCDLCANSKETYYDMKILLNHIKLYHMENKNQLNVNFDRMKNVKLYLSCKTCLKDFSKEEYFESHFQTCGINTEVECPVCKIPVINLDNNVLNIDIEDHLQNITLNLWKCEKCFLQFYACRNFNFHFKKEIENIDIVTIADSQNYSIHNSNLSKGDVNHVENIQEFLISIPDINNVKTGVKRKYEISNMTQNTCKVCKHCGLEIDIKNYINHIVCHIYKCPYCQLLQQSSADLKRHLELDANVNMEKYQYFLSEEAFKSHAYKGVLNLKTNTVYLNDYKSKITNLKCNVCLALSKTPCNSNKHARVLLHDVDILSCSNCTIKFSSDILFSEHICNNNKKYITCQICNIKYPTLDTFIGHFDIVHNSNEFDLNSKCPYCFEQQGDNILLKTHIRENHTIINYICSICDKDFSSKYKFLNHGYIDHGIVFFKCSKCNTEFSQVQYLIQHVANCV